MYPYSRKRHQKIQLHAAEQTSPASVDRLSTFLQENPDYGTLLFQVTGGQGAFPVAGAKVVIIKDLDDRHALSVTTTTDESGKTEELSLPAPSRSLSQSPNDSNVFATYRAEVTAPGYATVEVRDIPVFDGITTIQPVSLTPNLGNRAPTPEVEEIEDKEPDL